MERVVVIGATRTPIGKFMGALAPVSAVELGVAAAAGALAQCGVAPAEVDEVLFGQARQLGSGPNPARQVAIRAGMPDTTIAMTVNKACGSSLKAIDLARAALLLDGREIVVAGGMESMTNIPFVIPGLRDGLRLGHADALDGNFSEGFTCGILAEPMGMTAEYIADDWQISRVEQDEYALSSHARAEAAQRAGRFAEEITPITIRDRKGERVVDTDEHVRHGVTAEALAKLPPVFRPQGGTVHAGNSSGITDGAAALVLTTERIAKQRGIEPLAVVGASAIAGVPPRIMGIGPVPAVRMLCEKTGRDVDDWPLWELNEAFAAQTIACLRDLDLDRERVNVNGGAIALGHPIGATGARIVVTLLAEMRRRGVERAVATLCMSGGMGMAMEFERG